MSIPTLVIRTLGENPFQVVSSRYALDCLAHIKTERPVELMCRFVIESPQHLREVQAHFEGQSIVVEAVLRVEASKRGLLPVPLGQGHVTMAQLDTYEQDYVLGVKLDA